MNSMSILFYFHLEKYKRKRPGNYISVRLPSLIHLNLFSNEHETLG